MFIGFLFISNLIVPIIMVIAGYVLNKKSPKKINMFFGYRTVRSSMNQDTWDFAQKYAGKLWIRVGMVLLIGGILIQLPFIHGSESTFTILETVLICIQLVVLLATIIPVERALKQTFDEYGNYK